MSEAVEFEDKAAADRARDRHEEYICSVDDDKRMRTVHFVSDTPESLLTKLRSQDDGDRWEGYNVLRSDEPETVYQADMDKTEEATPDEHGVLTDDKGNGYGTQGWQIVDEDDDPGASTEQRGLTEVCDHAEGNCANGNLAACEYLQDTCGYAEGKVSDLITEPEPATADGPTDADVGPLSPPDGIEGEQVGAHLRSVRGYLNATDAAAEHIEKLRESLEHANDAARAVNGIRSEAGLDPLHFEKLEDANADLADLLRMVASTCEECHADHGEHDHAVTSGDREDIREVAVDGAGGTPVGTSDDTDRAAAKADT